MECAELNYITSANWHYKEVGKTPQNECKSLIHMRGAAGRWPKPAVWCRTRVFMGRPINLFVVACAIKVKRQPERLLAVGPRRWMAGGAHCLAAACSLGICLDGLKRARLCLGNRPWSCWSLWKVRQDSGAWSTHGLAPCCKADRFSRGLG